MTAYNCTIVSNFVTGTPFLGQQRIPTGGAAYCNLTNCIVMFNRSVFFPKLANYETNCALGFSCASPLPPGIGNIEADPLFTSPSQGDFRLSLGSPCIDTGTNLTSLPATDLAGLARLLDSNADVVAQVDMGAYEFNPYRFIGTQSTLLGLSCTLLGEPDRQARIESSPDFLNWTSVETLRLPLSGQTQIQVPSGDARFGFIRAVRVEL